MPADLTIESSVQVTGVLHKDERAPEGGYEIKGNNLHVYNIADPDYPIGEFRSVELAIG